MQFDIVSIFPSFFDVLDLSLMGKAQKNNLIDVRAHDLRNWAEGVHRSVDDTPYGGGAGMVMRPDVWGRALDELLVDGDVDDCIIAIPTPSGELLTQNKCEHIASTKKHVIIPCGRYEGIDARVTQYYCDRGVEVYEFSLGDYVLNGGEVAAVALVESVSRLVPGVVGNPESLEEESHSLDGMLEYPVYTKPYQWRQYCVPDVLM
ncbi:MAG: tRNA (guanosine(37)-N1)-methyltransferase TrmD, partial [Actinomycetaceae bacterium]|nr:tRNA (guanosine(37)-N1)-methyltransferase TrmD [Actinomycetaceae bacterium]